MREHGDRAGGLAERGLALQRQAVEVEAELGCEVRDLSAHLGDAVRMLDGADELAPLVAAHLDPMAGDPRRLVGDPVLGRDPVVLADPVPPATALGDPDDRDERRDHGQPGEQAPSAAARPGSAAGSTGWSVPRPPRSLASSSNASNSSPVSPE